MLVTVFSGCIGEEKTPETAAPTEAPLTVIEIVDVDVKVEGSALLYSIESILTVRNTGEKTAHNVIIYIYATNKNIRATVSIDRLILSNDGLIDKEFLGDIEPGEYKKGTLYISSADIDKYDADTYDYWKIVSADNAETDYW